MWPCLLGSDKQPGKVIAQLSWRQAALLISPCSVVSIAPYPPLYNPLRALQRIFWSPREDGGGGRPVPEIRREVLGEGSWGVGGAVTSLKPSCRTSSKFPRVRQASIVPAGGSPGGVSRPGGRRLLLPLHTKTLRLAHWDLFRVPHATYWKPRPEPN